LQLQVGVVQNERRGGRLVHLRQSVPSRWATTPLGSSVDLAIPVGTPTSNAQVRCCQRLWCANVEVVSSGEQSA